MSQDYNSTLNLPKTKFPMRAGLPKTEPVMLKKWEDEKLYEKLIEKNEGKPLYVLHDGPPYANGDIHLGTALNKVLKDFIVRYKNMSGHNSPFVPGWDTHGLPTELKARAKAGLDSETTISDIELRKICRDYALGYLDDQREQFKRLGAIGEWDNPYITLNNDFEATQIEIFAEMASKGYIYRGLKPVYWCTHCKTALAEAEIEYADDPCDSIYVKFKVTNDLGKLSKLGADLDKTYFVIWTTTTWTLPGNVAISVGPSYEYSVIKANDEFYVIATELYEEVFEKANIENYEVIGTIKGKDLELMETAHPLLDRTSYVLLGDHVTLDSGTGNVHTAPGHGVDDYEVVNRYPDLKLPILVPVDADGHLTAEAGKDLDGVYIYKGNKIIKAQLEENGMLLTSDDIVHQYPHCWRCKKPVLFRATDQWFCSIDDIKEATLKAIDTVKWIPKWGHERISNMVSERRDWCISRQRKWGVPIPIFFCNECDEPLMDKETILAVAELFRKEGSDAWFVKSAEEILPKNTKCHKCKNTTFTKEKDIMDVWFDAGTTHAAVLRKRDNLKWPADLYLEGADQYRGWFQSSLLTSVATNGKSPYEMALSHGWVVDGEGRKMSKSLGNGIESKEIIDQYGADILRLWVASSDFNADIRISKGILQQLSEAYRKIRNTARYILGNITDFDPNKDSVPIDELYPIDKWAISQLNELIEKVVDGYEEFEFHQVYHSVHNFCVVEMSNFYLDVLKDRLYTQGTDSKSRRAAQTTIYIVLDAITKMLSPILAFTAEEIWSFMPHSSDCVTEAVLLNDMPKPIDIDLSDEFLNKWDKVQVLRDDVKKALEPVIKDKTIRSSLEAKVTLIAKGEEYKFIKDVENELGAVFIVSEIEVKEGNSDDLEIIIDKATGEKCERCWSYSDFVGKDEKHPTICNKCLNVLEQ